MRRYYMIDMRPIIYGNKYLNVPGGDIKIFNDKLIRAVEEIGKQYGTVNGSDLKKGICFIKEKINCDSKRQIKLALTNVKISLVHDNNVNLYVFRCSKLFYFKILKCIGEYANNEITLMKINEETFSDYFIYKPKVGIMDTIINIRNENIINIANNFLQKIDELDSNIY